MLWRAALAAPHCVAALRCAALRCAVLCRDGGAQAGRAARLSAVLAPRAAPPTIRNRRASSRSVRCPAPTRGWCLDSEASLPSHPCTAPLTPHPCRAPSWSRRCARRRRRTRGGSASGRWPAPRWDRSRVGPPSRLAAAFHCFAATPGDRRPQDGPGHWRACLLAAPSFAVRGQIEQCAAKQLAVHCF